MDHFIKTLQVIFELSNRLGLAWDCSTSWTIAWKHSKF